MRAKTNTSIIPGTIKLDGRTYLELLEKAEALNSYFHSVLKQLAHALLFDDYDLLNRCNFSCPLMSDITILGSLDPKKACGQDGITSKLLKECAEEISHSLKLKK